MNNPNGVLPDSILDSAQEFSDGSNRSDWALGDLAALAVDTYGAALGKGEVRRQLANRTRYQPSGIRAREAVSRYWQPEQREEFDLLDWSHFRLAQRQPDPCADLRHCIESAPDFGGRPMPYNAYCEMVKARKQTKPIGFAECMARALSSVKRALEAAATPEQRAAAEQAAGMLEKWS